MKIPTKKVTLAGREYPFHFGTGALYLLGIELGLEDIKMKDVDSIISDMPLGNIPVILWTGFLSGASKTGRDTEKVPSVDEIKSSLKKDPYALDQAMDIVHGIQEEYSEDIEGNPPPAKGKK